VHALLKYLETENAPEMQGHSSLTNLLLQDAE
jgi:hypothetical protein